MTEVCACVDVLECMCHLGRYDGVPITVYRHLSMYESSLALHYLKMEGETQTGGEGEGTRRKRKRGARFRYATTTYLYNVSEL